ncbi:hypothetical protein FUAX_55020 (plasmid) [Fulvitalea axinellae]|uniref:Uncharacterized protein n=1 Tax=Fulvitalea axinellae TaxID=1182444 RepID=A0AAU9CVK2_9BACT|nr:hypothetical protein FUAX_55020 [Fulvitalea axinellae]
MEEIRRYKYMKYDRGYSFTVRDVEYDRGYTKTITSEDDSILVICTPLRNPFEEADSVTKQEGSYNLTVHRGTQTLNYTLRNEDKVAKEALIE